MPGTSGRVLVVDDSKVIRQLIKVNLELEGFEVVTAADGAECLDVVHGVRPDVVTLDITMPRLDGLRAADRLRSDPRTRHIPAVVISAGAQSGAGPGGGEWHGVDAFLAKPFDPADLLAVVRRLMRGEAGGGAATAQLGDRDPSVGAFAGPSAGSLPASLPGPAADVEEPGTRPVR